LETLTDLLAQVGDAPADAEPVSETFLHGVEGVPQARTA
jgi:hypothetical protein